MNYYFAIVKRKHLKFDHQEFNYYIFISFYNFPIVTKCVNPLLIDDVHNIIYRLLRRMCYHTFVNNMMNEIKYAKQNKQLKKGGNTMTFYTLFENNF